MESREEVYCQDKESKLEDKILDIINEVTESKYTGGLKVVCEGDIYTLFLYLDVQFAPIQMCYQGSEDSFKEYIRNEFKLRRLETIPRGRLIQRIINNEERRDCKN